MVHETSSGIQDRDRDTSVPAFALYPGLDKGQAELGYLIQILQGKEQIHTARQQCPLP